jgi:uncharacterized protein (UPF0332 family)
MHAKIPTLIAKQVSPLSNLLVCVDGSKHSIKAFNYAARLAEKMGSRITLLNVQEQRLHRASPNTARELSELVFSKALDAIEGAEALLNIDKAEIAVGRAYYSMFYVAEALLYNEFGLRLNRHGQVIAAYGKNFAKTKVFDPKYHRWLRDGFDKRISGEYGVDSGIEVVFKKSSSVFDTATTQRGITSCSDKSCSKLV